MQSSFKISLSKLVENMPPSGIRAFFDLVLSMDDVVSLGVGEPDFKTPWTISQFAIKKIKDGYTTYTSNSGLMELREEISKYLNQTYSLSYDAKSEILITVGVSEGLDLALRAISNPGDEILIHEPCYVSYKPMSELAGAKVNTLLTPKDQNFKILPDQLEKAITPRTKAFIFNYPCNPTGATYTREELMALAEVIRKKNILLISDEIYHQLSFDFPHVSIASFPGMDERTLYLNGFSKGYAMTGWRVGYACGPRYIIDAMKKIHQYSIMCVPAMGQFAAIEALRVGGPTVTEMKDEYLRRRNYIVHELNRIGFHCHKPGGAFYVYPEIPKGFSSGLEFANQLLQDQKVAVVPGDAFGPLKHHIRISYASSMTKLQTAVQRMETFINNACQRNGL